MVKEKESWIIKIQLTKVALTLEVALLVHQQANLCSEHYMYQMNQMKYVSVSQRVKRDHICSHF